MKNTVRIKSTATGMKVYLSADLEFEELLKEIARKFGESAKFFGTAKTVLSLEGRELTEEEEAQIVDVITENTQLDIVCILEEQEEVCSENVPNLQTEPEPEQRMEEVPLEERVVFYKRSIQDGETIQSEKDIVVFGNVSENAVLMSQSSIYVFGGLYGEAYAGIDNGNDYVVAAMDFSPRKVEIGRLEYLPKKTYKWRKKLNMEPQIAYVRDKKIITEQITKELLNSLI